MVAASSAIDGVLRPSIFVSLLYHLLLKNQFYKTLSFYWDDDVDDVMDYNSLASPYQFSVQLL